MPPKEDGQNFQVHVVKIVYDHEKKLAQEPGHTHFICYVNDYQYKYIMLYNNIINHI